METSAAKQRQEAQSQKTLSTLNKLRHKKKRIVQMLTQVRKALLEMLIVIEMRYKGMQFVGSMFQ